MGQTFKTVNSSDSFDICWIKFQTFGAATLKEWLPSVAKDLRNECFKWKSLLDKISYVGQCQANYGLIQHVSSEDKFIILSLLWLSCCTSLLVTTIQDFFSMFSVSKVMSIIEMDREKQETDWNKKIPSSFLCKSLYSKKF